MFCGMLREGGGSGGWQDGHSSFYLPSQAADAPSTCATYMAPLPASKLPPDEIRSGETIAYYSMAFVCGDPRGYREAVVLSVNPSADASTPLKLDSGDIITATMMLKRVIDCSGRKIGEGEALWRKLRTYKLVAGDHEAPTQASAFNHAIQEAVRQAFDDAQRAGRALREGNLCGATGEMDESISTTAGSTAGLTSSSAPPSAYTNSMRHATHLTHPEDPLQCEESGPDDAGAATALVSMGTTVLPASSSGSSAPVPAKNSDNAAPASNASITTEGLAHSDDRPAQHTVEVDDALLVDVNDYLKSIPTRLERAKIRHQAKKRPGGWHVPRSRKRHNQKKCAVTRSGTNIYHAHAVKARTTKEILQRPGVKFRLVELRELRQKFPKSRTETVDLSEDVDWPASVQRISESIVPEGLTFPDIGDGDPCRCVGDCFMDSCHNALLSIYCTPETCSLGGDCCNSPRTHPALKLYDTCRVGYGVHTIAYIEVGEVIGEYVGRLFEYPPLLKGSLPKLSNKTAVTRCYSTRGLCLANSFTLRQSCADRSRDF